MRLNKEFVKGDYSNAEKAEIFVIDKLNSELIDRNISQVKFFHKIKKQDVDISLKSNKDDFTKIIWNIDVHECQFGPPKGGFWPWPLHLPHGVENIMNPQRYKSHFEKDLNFSMILIDKRKRGEWEDSDILLITKEIIEKCDSKIIRSNTFGHNREEMMYIIPYELLKKSFGKKNCIDGIINKLNL